MISNNYVGTVFNRGTQDLKKKAVNNGAISATDTKTTTETRSSSTSCSYTSSEYTSELDSPFASGASLLGKTSPQGSRDAGMMLDAFVGFKLFYSTGMLLMLQACSQH